MCISNIKLIKARSNFAPNPIKRGKLDPVIGREDEIRRLFGKAEHLMIPFQAVALIEEFKDLEVYGYYKDK